MEDVLQVPDAPIVLSTASVYPEKTPAAFEMAARLGYDGIEIMVTTDPASQDIDVLRRLSDYHQIPILSVHAPCLLLTQRVWGREPWGKLVRSKDTAEKLGARVVVVHPPFSWQREYARGFREGLARLGSEHPGISFAVENMFPVRMAGREFVPYSPGYDPTRVGFDAYTLDLSHCATARSDALAMADAMGAALAHVHLGDGTGDGRDEHLVPGRGKQPCAQLLESLAARGFSGSVAVEVSSRRAADRASREADLAEALQFARKHLSAASTVDA